MQMDRTRAGSTTMSTPVAKSLDAHAAVAFSADFLEKIDATATGPS